MSIKTIRGNLLFWKITAVFTGLLIILGIIFIWIASRFSDAYLTTAHQQLYGNLADHLASFTKPFRDGRPDTIVTHDIIHSTMVANPSVEVYLLDPDGNIVDYVVPDTTVQLHRVNMAPIHQWLVTRDGDFPKGDNPKYPRERSIFSVAPVYEKGNLVGYVYVVLASERQKEILAAVDERAYVRLSASIFFAALLTAFVVGVVTFFLITDCICIIAGTLQRFKEGDYSARIQGYASGNIGALTSTFNEMADVIVRNFEKITTADRFRQELIANVSHDLRTPLSIMQGYVETLMMKKDRLALSDRDKYLTIIHEGTRKLSGLVEQLFQYAKLEANVITPAKEWFSLGDLASDILMAYQLQANSRAINLVLEAPQKLPAVFADIALTERVFQNLLENAFKFTLDGGTIAVALSPGNTGVRVKVSDTGIGIAQEELAHIFDRHKQSQASGTSKGMGIGLAIVKKILDLHQAAIEVTSAQGIGTSFQFELPIEKRRLSVS